MGKIYRVKVDDEVFMVEIEEVSQTPYVKNVEQVREEASLVNEKKKEVPLAPQSPPTEPKKEVVPQPKEKGSGGSVVRAPLPGKVLVVKVKPGDKVKKGDLLLTIEAMKMENEIFAGEEHTVKEVYVKPGDTVEENALLIKYED